MEINKPTVRDMKKQTEELIDKAFQKGFQVGKEDERDFWSEFIVRATNTLIEQGRNEAWEAAKKLVSMEYGERNKVLSDGVLTIETNEEIFIRCTAAEAIQKIQEYEKKEELKVGDEIKIIKDGRKAIITKIRSDGEIYVLDYTGLTTFIPHGVDWKKTGKHFDINKILQQIEEE